MKIVVGNDHVGLELATTVINYLEDFHHEILHIGTYEERQVDYPNFAQTVGEIVTSGEVDAGILICGTGVGMNIAVNKVKGVRCVVCSEPYSAKLSKEHNDTNVLALGSRVVGSELAKMIIDSWLASHFMASRHSHRVKMISELEAKDP